MHTSVPIRNRQLRVRTLRLPTLPPKMIERIHVQEMSLVLEEETSCSPNNTQVEETLHMALHSRICGCCSGDMTTGALIPWRPVAAARLNLDGNILNHHYHFQRFFWLSLLSNFSRQVKCQRRRSSRHCGLVNFVVPLVGSLLEHERQMCHVVLYTVITTTRKCGINLEYARCRWRPV